MMFLKKIVDYSEMPIDKATKQGVIKTCERCGRPGAYFKFIIPKSESYLEKWTHSRHYKIFSAEQERACTRTTSIDGTTSGWSWSEEI
jgi:hypothetical protein